MENVRYGSLNPSVTAGAHCVDGIGCVHIEAFCTAFQTRFPRGARRTGSDSMDCPFTTRPAPGPTKSNPSVWCWLSCPGANDGVEASPAIGPGPSAEGFRNDAPLCAHRRRVPCTSRWTQRLTGTGGNRTKALVPEPRAGIMAPHQVCWYHLLTVGIGMSTARTSSLPTSRKALFRHRRVPLSGIG